MTTYKLSKNINQHYHQWLCLIANKSKSFLEVVILNFGRTFVVLH